MHPDMEPVGVRADGERLESWKEIAAYLRRDVTTVQRWERREGLPVHRLVHARQGSVYAFTHELDAWVRSRDASIDARVSAEPVVPPTVGTVGGAGSPQARLATRRLPRRAAVVGVVLVAAALIAFFFWRRSPAERPRVRDASTDTALAGMSAGPIAIAVLENRTGDASLDGIGRLAAERMIRTAARASHAAVLPQPIENPQTVTGSGGARSASLLVAGAYYRRESTLEFQVRILDASSGRLLHGLAPIAEPQSRMVDALDRLEDRVGGAIAIHFDEFFGGLHVVGHPPTLSAYREYRAGLEIFRSDYQRSVTHLQGALALDPDFTLPLVIMEFVYANLGEDEQVERVLARMEERGDRSTAAERLWIEYARASLEGRRPQALRVLLDLERAVPGSRLVNFNLMEQAMAMNRPTLAIQASERMPTYGRDMRHSIGSARSIHTTSAFHLLGAYERELEEARRAQQYAPGTPRFFEAEARALAALGRTADAIRVVDRSLSTGPAAGISDISSSGVMEEASAELRVHGHRDASLQMAARAVEWFERRPPDVRSSREARTGLANALYMAERWADAHRAYSALLADYPDHHGYTAYVGQAAARSGNLPEARAMADRLARVPAVGIFGREARAWATFERARIAALLGEHQRAVELLRDAITQGFPVNLNIHSNPDFESLRTDAEFVALTRPE